MLKMVELSVQHSSGQTRAAARGVVVAYVANYSLKKKLGKLLDLCAGQLGYQQVSGRLAAAELLRSLVSTVGPERIESHAIFLFFSLGPRLVNDDSAEARKAVAAALGTLVKTALPGAVEKMLKPTLTWFQSEDNPEHAQLACHLLCIFLDELGPGPLAPHLGPLLGRLAGHVAADGDHLALQALHLATRLVSPGPETLARAAPGQAAALWRAVHGALLHSHAWARTLACRLVGHHLAQTPAPRLLAQLQGAEGPDHWLATAASLRSLMLDLLEQLGLQEPEQELGTQVTKNLVALAKLLLLPGLQEVEGAQAISFHWLVKKAIKVANQELISTPKVTAKRTLVFSLVAACCLEAAEGDVVAVLPLVLPPLHRQIASNSQDTELKGHCQEVLDLVKAKVDPDIFSKIYMEVQMNLAKRKGERSAQKKQNYILDPKLAAKRKIQQNEAKKKAKKAKINANH
jgi:U3 small nucleolar RNA-associated protein 20